MEAIRLPYTFSIVRFEYCIRYYKIVLVAYNLFKFDALFSSLHTYYCNVITFSYNIELQYDTASLVYNIIVGYLLSRFYSWITFNNFILYFRIISFVKVLVCGEG